MDHIQGYPCQELKSILTIDHIVTMFYRHIAEDFKDVPEQHDFWELVYADTGEIIIVEEGEEYLLRSGEMYLHRPNRLHFIESRGKEANIFIASFNCQSPLMYEYSRYLFSLNGICRNLLSNLMAELINSPFHAREGQKEHTLSKSEPKSDSFGSLQCIRMYLELLFITLMRMENRGWGNKISADAEQDYHSVLCNDIAGYLKSNIFGKITVDKLCLALGCGKTAASAEFKKHTGKTIMQYYTELKIEEAKRMLREEKKNISEISDALCFSSPFYFSAAFKKHTGLSPSEYIGSITDGTAKKE